MATSIPDTVDAQAAAATTKVEDMRQPGRYATSAALAGAYVGVAVVLLITVTGPLQLAESPWTKLVQGLVFGIALIAVIFAGAELSTGNMMTGIQGLLRRRISARACVGLIVFSFVGNLVGSIVFAWLVHESGVLNAAAPGKAPAGLGLLESIVGAKTSESASQLFFRGILCNFLVCLAVWMAARTKSETAKIAVIFWCLLAFIGSGFEHVVANMTVLSLGMFEGLPDATLGAFAGNMLFVGLGNLVGGGLLIGLGYALVGGRVAPAAIAESPVVAEQPIASKAAA